MYSFSIKNIKSPLNYIGGKSKILNQILPFFPLEINDFVDLFAGGCNVGINTQANRYFFNDNLSFLIEMYQKLQENELDFTINYIEERIKELNLSQTNEEGYKTLRREYNLYKNPLDLFVLVAFSFNHQIRFNNNHKFNNPFGKNRSSFNPKMKKNLKDFIIRVKEIQPIFSKKCFTEFDFSFLDENDFVYCDPPYLITIGTYNDGKIGFKGWSEKQEYQYVNYFEVNLICLN